MILKQSEVLKIVQGFKQRNPMLKYQYVSFEEVMQIYNAVKYDSVNTRKTPLEMVSLIEDIANGIAIGEDNETNILLHSDIRHMAYFDNFIEKGATKDLLETLSKYGVAKEALRGLRYNQDFNEYVAHGVKVNQKWGYDEEGYKVITSFYIIKDGEVVYSAYRDGSNVKHGSVEEIKEQARKEFEARVNYEVLQNIPSRIKKIMYIVKSKKTKKESYQVRYYDTKNKKFISKDKVYDIE